MGGFLKSAAKMAGDLALGFVEASSRSVASTSQYDNDTRETFSRLADDISQVRESCNRHSDTPEDTATRRSSVTYQRDFSVAYAQSKKALGVNNEQGHVNKPALRSEIFKANDNLEKVEVSKGIYGIGIGSFQDCINLSEIKLPNSLEVIEKEAFRHCINLKELVIPPGVKRIEDGAFLGCSSLESVSISNSITYIGDKVFPKGDKLVIRAVKGSYAYKYLQEKGYTVSQMNEYEYYNMKERTSNYIPSAGNYEIKNRRYISGLLNSIELYVLDFVAHEGINELVISRTMQM